MVALQREFDAYQAALPGLLGSSNEGKYVVMRGDQLCDFFPTYDTALRWAYEAFGLDPFFVKLVAADQATVHFTRDLPCRA